MFLFVDREVFTDKSTIGSLYKERQEGDVLKYDKICDTLEPCCRQEWGKPWTSDLKIPGVTAIPYGRYRMTIRNSPKFGKDMPHIENVSDFQGILCHPGNFSTSTEGCLCLGLTRAEDFVGKSREAFTLFFDMLKQVIDSGEEVWVTYEKADYVVTS